MAGPPAAARRRLAIQRTVSHALAPLWLPLVLVAMRLGFGWRLEGAAALRAHYRALRRAHRGGVLICPNHLTMLDSALVAWALGGPLFFLRDFAALPWNLPERRHFAARAWSRAAVWLLKCLPIERGGERRAQGETLAQAAWLLRRGEAVLVFPEGGRSRTGRVERDVVTYGAGRLLAAAPGTRVLCVHLRGERQTAMSNLPARRQRFRVAWAELEPRSHEQGLRRALDCTRQIVATLAALEERTWGAAGPSERTAVGEAREEPAARETDARPAACANVGAATGTPHAAEDAGARAGAPADGATRGAAAQHVTERAKARGAAVP